MRRTALVFPDVFAEVLPDSVTFPRPGQDDPSTPNGRRAVRRHGFGYQPRRRDHDGLAPGTGASHPRLAPDSQSMPTGRRLRYSGDRRPDVPDTTADQSFALHRLPDGRALLVWGRQHGADGATAAREIRSALSRAEGGWQLDSLQMQDPASYGTVSSVSASSLAINASGRGLLAWRLIETVDGTPRGVVVVRRFDDGWQAPQILDLAQPTDSSLTLSAGTPRVAIRAARSSPYAMFPAAAGARRSISTSRRRRYSTA